MPSHPAAAAAAPSKTLGFLAEIRIKESLVRHEGRLPLTGTYEDLRRQAIAVVHNTWPHTQDRLIHRIIWRP
jgi:hypothetical protein